MAKQFIDRHPYARTLQFSGYTWGIKASTAPVGPGPNYFSDLESNVFVDSEGKLHLKIVQNAGHWFSSEVVNTLSLGYGRYTFILSSSVAQFDPNVVLGLFTWDDLAPEFHYREIDIEIARWGNPQNQNAQYVVQPYRAAENLHRFEMTSPNSLSTHLFEWRKDSILFTSHPGKPENPGGYIETWSYTGADNPPPGLENIRLNLWLMNGKPPEDAKEVEVVVQAFHFTPLKQ